MDHSNHINRSFLQNLGFYTFGLIPGVLVGIGNLAMHDVWWTSPKGSVTFQFGNRPESVWIFVVSAYLIALHFFRYVMASVNADEENVISETPYISSISIQFVSYLSAISYPLFFLPWVLLATKTQQVNYWLPGVFYALCLSSYFIISKDYLFGIRVAERKRTLYNNQQANNHVVSEEKVARKELPKIKFKDIYGNADIKRRLSDAARAITASRKEGTKPRNGILLHGEPGNGKTIFAEAMAGELGLPLLKLTHSDVASQWVGERTVRIKAAFDQAIKAQPCVLFIDEIDSFIKDRSNAQGSHKEDDDVVNSLLTLLVDIRSHRVVVMAATNYMDRLDGAAVREGRFDFKVEITPPDEEARIGLLTSGLQANLPKIAAAPETIKSVAQRWNGFSVKRILAVTEELPSYVADLQEKGQKKTALDFDDFMAALRRIQGQRGLKPENVKAMADLVLTEETREALDMMAARLRDPERVERLGGSLPTGILFYGPPGTGKTEACKSLAKEANWAFLAATGGDLARDQAALDKLYTKAKEMRPTLIFIDEADELLRSREYSSNTTSTNRLLTLMDGVGDRVRDVVWVAATNHPDQIDSAMLRGGRFTEKVEFQRPDESQLVVHIDKWLSSRKIGLATGLTAEGIAATLGDKSIADTNAVLQYAVNRAIGRVQGDHVVLTEADILRSMTMVIA